MPSVLISCKLLRVGGNESHVLALCELFSSCGIPTTVATRASDFAKHHRHHLTKKGIAVVTTPFSFSSPASLKNMWASTFWFRLPPTQFTHLLAIGLGGFHRTLRRCLTPDGKAMYWEDGIGTGNSEQHVAMLHAMDKIAATSGPIADRVAAVSGRKVFALPPLTKMQVQLNGREKGARENEPLQVSFLGRPSRDKGLDMLIDIWPAIAAQNVKLHVHGGGAELEAMKASVAANGLTDSIIFHGYFDHARQLSEIMAKTDLLVLPSRTEGLPNVLLEAMAHGVPFVATNVGGIPDLAFGNPEIMIVGAYQEDLAAGLTEMIARIRSGQIDPARQASFYQAHYAWPAVSEQWLNFLEIQA